MNRTRNKERQANLINHIESKKANENIVASHDKYTNYTNQSKVKSILQMLLMMIA